MTRKDAVSIATALAANWDASDAEWQSFDTLLHAFAAWYYATYVKENAT